MKRNRELKNDALKAMDGHWGWAILVCIVYGAIVGLVSAPNTVTSLMSSMGGSSIGATAAIAGLSIITGSVTLLGSIFGSNPLTAGFINSVKLYYKDSDMSTIQNMFKYGFGGGRYWRNVLGMFLMNLFIGLWTLLFIVPGIIKSYAYALTPYILIDNPELSPNEARLKSIEMMRGHKGKLFGLDLSFIGWYILCLLSLGIGFIWITPYVRTTKAAFYCNLKEELNPQPVVTEAE
ncbi:MAG: DUF975 family protein [Bacteroidaceae bacterium]|nr:DUF975 family protein [Bacteroidaceae bacterium]